MKGVKGKSSDFRLSQTLAYGVVKKRVSAATSFYAAFRPLFRQVGRWCTGIPCEIVPPHIASDLSISWNGVHAKDHRAAFTCREEQCESITWDDPEGWSSGCTQSTVVARLPQTLCHLPNP